MGEAKRRGSFEERKALAVKRQEQERRDLEITANREKSFTFPKKKSGLEECLYFVTIGAALLEYPRIKRLRKWK
jgi:hypothetical protein